MVLRDDELCGRWLRLSTRRRAESLWYVAEAENKIDQILFGEFGLAPGEDAVVGDTGGHRKTVDASYFGWMRSAQIVVTCNPSHWDGDFRLFEALASGALVFTDELHTPQPH